MWRLHAAACSLLGSWCEHFLSLLFVMRKNMVIWSRWGILVILLAVACFIATQVVTDSLSQDPQYYKSHGWPKAVAAWIAAVILWPLGRYMNRTQERQLIDPQSGQVVTLRTGGGHALFFIPMEYWGIILAVVGVALLFV